jgi:tetratricopeptide (TPR) repeat protein
MTPTNRPLRSFRRVGAAIGVAIALSLASAPSRAAPPKSEVEQLASEAYAQQAAGKYPEAIATYMKAYELSHAGAILFNIAMIYDRRLDEHALAIEFFRRYLQAPDAEAEFVKVATERVSALKHEADEESARRKAPPPPEPPTTAPEAPAAPSSAQDAAPPPPPRKESAERAGAGTWRATSLVVGGVGLASLGASVVLGLVAKSKNDEANGLCDASTCKTTQGVDADHQAGKLATAATVTFIAGAALVATGVTLYFVAPRSRASNASNTNVALGVQSTGSGVALRIQGGF